MRKEDKDKLCENINIRVSTYEKNYIKGLADLYANGNVSLFLVYSAFNSERKFLSEDELEESNRRIKKEGRSPLFPE